MATREAGVLYCSFCGKSQKDVRKLIAGPAVQICEKCVAICVEIINDDAQSGAAPTAAEEGRSKKKEKRKVTKKKQARQPRRTNSAHSFSNLTPKH